ncbi:MAG: hypothetical protein KH760_08800 [Clostridiales bacterium]|jgi:hypothetical protein|nr:hypothetical protein [Clostridiales bacterium]DAR38791.1 MAG TPA: hypothetical protein [Caudoviricetes sp.]
MPNKRDLRMEKYKISTNRYRELKYFCMQYREKKSRLRAITELSVSSMERSKGGNKTSDRTADIAMQRLQLENDIQMIETAAIEADSALYSYIISNVVDGIPYEYLSVPAGRRQFYQSRRKFFNILSIKKG